MFNVSKRLISIGFILSALGCGQGFQGKIRPASEWGSAGGGGGGTCCGPGPISSPRSDLLDNPGFEANLQGWEDWGNSLISTNSAHSGTHSMQLSGGAGGRGQEVIYRLKAGGKYVLKAYARVTSLSDEVYLGVKFADNSNNLMDEQKVRINTQSYSEYTVNFTVPLSVSSARIYMQKLNATTVTADFDDFSLMMTGAPTNAPMESPIANPGNYQPVGPAAGWTLVMNDDFNGSGLDSNVWNSGFWFNYSINNELKPSQTKVIDKTVDMYSL